MMFFRGNNIEFVDPMTYNIQVMVSISDSVSELFLGCMVTFIPIDFFPLARALPEKTSKILTCVTKFFSASLAARDTFSAFVF